MKKVITFLLVLIVASVMATPAFAQYTPEEAPPSKGFVEVDYAPISLSGMSGWSANFNAFRANAEFNVYRGIGAGVDFTLGNSSTLKLAGIERSDAKFTDTILYAKVPINVSNLAKSDTDGYPAPQPSEFHVIAAYKMHYLITEQAPKTTWLSASGVGIGLGFESPIQKIRLEGQATYYPQMVVQSASTPANTYAYYRDLSWRLAIKARLRSNIDASLGYSGTTQSFSDGNLYYNGFNAGFKLKF